MSKAIEEDLKESARQAWALNTKLSIGQSPMRKEYLEPSLVNFQITAKNPETGKYETMKPWKGKGVPVQDWFRNTSALGAKRYVKELATFTHTEMRDHYFIDDSVVKSENLLTAFFSSEVNGHKYNVAARRLPSNIKPGDRVILDLLGCCSIAGAKKVNNDTTRIEQVERKMARPKGSKTKTTKGKKSTKNSRKVNKNRAPKE